MMNKFAKMALPVALAVSTLGMGVAATVTPAGAATKAKAKAVAVKPVTLKGTIVRTQATKHVFWFKVATKEYRAVYSAMTKFAVGSSASLVKGKVVTVTGTPVGKAGAVIRATSITA